MEKCQSVKKVGPRLRSNGACNYVNNNTKYHIFHSIQRVMWKLDKLNISLHGNTRDVIDLLDLLKQADFKVVRDVVPDKSKYGRMRELLYGDVTLECLYRPSVPTMPAGLLEINDPNEDTLEFLASAIAHVHLAVKVSLAEIALDIVAEHDYLIANAIKDHLYLPWQRQPSSDDDTYYTTNLRRASKGHRVYAKKVDDIWATRLELVLKRTVLKRLGVEMTNAYSALMALDLRPYIQFRHLDFDGLVRYFRRCQPISVKQVLNPKRYNDQTESYLRSMLRVGDKPLMFQIERIRGLSPTKKFSKNKKPNYGRFIIRDDELEALFFAKLEYPI